MKFGVFGIWICLSEIGILATDGADIHVHGYIGKSVIITCSHKLASSSIKYFCRANCKNKDILVKSDQAPTGRYTLEDFRNGTFTVNITHLQESDSGTYWCGVDRFIKDTYNEVSLTVSNDSDTNTNRPATPKPAGSSPSSMTQSSFSTSSASGDITTSSSPTDPVISSRPAFYENTQSSLSSGPLTFTAIGLTVMVIIFGAVLCIWNKQNRKSHSSNVDAEIQGTKNTTESAGDYEEIMETQQQTEDTITTIYSTVNKSMAANQIQEPPLYSTLSI